MSSEVCRRGVQLRALVVCVAFGFALVSSLGTGGAEAKRKCHPSYKGKCLKVNAGDYDCLGGSGDGPNYTGRVRVVGTDVFRLDADRDGIGCE